MGIFTEFSENSGENLWNLNHGDSAMEGWKRKPSRGYETEVPSSNHMPYQRGCESPFCRLSAIWLMTKASFTSLISAHARRCESPILLPNALLGWSKRIMPFLDNRKGHFAAKLWVKLPWFDQNKTSLTCGVYIESLFQSTLLGRTRCPSSQQWGLYRCRILHSQACLFLNGERCPTGVMRQDCEWFVYE